MAGVVGVVGAVGDVLSAVAKTVLVFLLVIVVVAAATVVYLYWVHHGRACDGHGTLTLSEWVWIFGQICIFFNFKLTL